MSKYDFEVDLSQNSSTGIILNKIEKGSTVLEFGCAAGRMTRYMKEVLGCRVYIVEYDAAAYERALEYAEDGLCDDILNFQWVERFKDEKFDAILFADVLEHLTLPEKALKYAAELLRDSGGIYVSIPNITHNDVLLKAFEERFDYTSTGLLDDSHVHFWGMDNIAALADQCGLHIGEIEGTYCPTGHTEQYDEVNRPGNTLLENILKERQCGEVYQFVVSFYKSRCSETAYTFKRPTIQSHIYLDTGKDFNADEMIAFDAEYSGHGSYTAHYVISDTEKIQRVRFDPVELQACILRSVTISQGERELELQYPSGVKLESGLLLPGDDAMVYGDTLLSGEPIRIDAEIVLWGEMFLKLVQNGYIEALTVSEEVSNLVSWKRELQKRNEPLLAENERLRESICDLHQEIALLRGNVDGLLGANQLLRENIERLSGENEELRRDLGAYIILANSKDQRALELEQSLARYQIPGMARLRACVVRGLKGIKRRLKRLIRKEEP